jgi:uncharacterized protein YdaU (DUF1376 family)
MEDLAYRRMLDLFYLKEMPLPSSVQTIAKLIRMRTHTECIANVLQEFWTLTESGYVNGKAEDNLSAIYKKSDKARRSAEKRWEKQRLKNANALNSDSEGNASAMLPINLIPNTEDIKSIDDSSESPINNLQDELFEKFWAVYRKQQSQGKAKAKTAFKSFLRGKSEANCRYWMNLMLSYYMHCLDSKVFVYESLHASTFINKKRWEDNPEFMQEFKTEWLKECQN